MEAPRFSVVKRAPSVAGFSHWMWAISNQADRFSRAEAPFSATSFTALKRGASTLRIVFPSSRIVLLPDVLCLLSRFTPHSTG